VSARRACWPRIVGWFARPDDERYLSLTDLYDAVRRRAETAQVRTVESRAVKGKASRDNGERLAVGAGT